VSEPVIAVIIPCLNEEAAIGKVVRDFSEALPGAEVYVFDNASEDGTVLRAAEAGAKVVHSPLRGKGNVVHHMFAVVDADVYVMVDGDGTYDPACAKGMVSLLQGDDLDMVVGIRDDSGACGAYRRGHQLGNRLFNRITTLMHGQMFSDIFSGYRVFSRRFVKSFPALSKGFEIETELSIHCIELRLRTAEVVTPYGARQEDSASKLNTYRDGYRILMTMLRLYKETNPFQFFGLFSLVLAALSLLLGWPVVLEWLRTGLVPRMPTAVLSAAIMTIASILFVCGLLLESVSQARLEQKKMAYLACADRCRKR